MNQVEALRQAKIEASSLNSNTPQAEKDRIHQDLATGHPRTRLLYVTPELCSTDRFRQRLQLVHQQRELARIVVDEAHCISEWGHDFRKDFKRLSWFRDTFSDVPIMALTATANQRVLDDILDTLGLSRTPERLEKFIMTASRPNLHFEIRFTNDESDNRLADFISWLKSCYERRAHRIRLEGTNERVENFPGIIYTTSRDECECLAAQLRYAGIGARPFHAKLTKETKEETLARWINNEPGYDIIVATTAFGMGIDKENVRFVTHWRLPKSFEGYYQEAGRAGRDGNASLCFMYYSREDSARITALVERDAARQKNGGGGGNAEARLKSLAALVAYCEDVTSCRHLNICKYFGTEQAVPCDFACDWHKDPQDLQRRWLKGLASEELVSTQAALGQYDMSINIDD